MHTTLLVLLIVLVIVAVAWSPILAAIAAALLFVAFLAYIGLRPQGDERGESPASEVESPERDRG